jgi:hypothetical protein
MPEPITEAGRRHVFLTGGNPERRGIVGRAVCAIEAEARRAVLTTLREWVDEWGLTAPLLGSHTDAYGFGREDAFLAVLAEIDRLMAEGKPQEVDHA